MALIVEQEDSRFRARWQEYSIDWLPDTMSNRKAILVFLRLLQDERGKPVFTQEEHLLREMMASVSCSASCSNIGARAGRQAPETEGMQVSDPTSIRQLVTPGFCVSSIASPLRWVVFCLVLYYHGMPLSVPGSWFGAHKTTILRRMLGLVLVLWPIVYRWILDNVSVLSISSTRSDVVSSQW